MENIVTNDNATLTSGMPGDSMISMVGGVRARIGVIISASNRMVETQLRFSAPPQLGVHINRMKLRSGKKKSLTELTDDIIPAALLLASAKVDIIVLQASYIAMEEGPEGEARLIRAISDATGTPALTSPQAMVEAMRVLELRRIVVVSPFDQANNNLERAYLKLLGFEVVHDVALASSEREQNIAITPARWGEIVKANARADADGYFLSGSNTTMMESVALIERELGKPAVSSTQATLWACVRRLSSKLGPISFSPDLGCLFARNR